MNLYKLIVLHGGPKSSCTAILRYSVAENDEQIFQELNDEAYWQDSVERWEENADNLPDEDRGPNPKDEIMRSCGNLTDDNWDDAFYGIWKYGWENLGPISETEIAALKKFKIIE